MTDRRPRLEGKVAIVTGAGSSGPGVGTGKAIAILFAREGCSVLLVDNERARAEETLAEIEAEGGTASVFVGDVTRSADCLAMVEAAVERYGGLSTLVNNVGITVLGQRRDGRRGGLAAGHRRQPQEHGADVEARRPRMIEGGGGAVVNMSSFLGLRSGSAFESVPYSVSKGGYCR